MSDRAEIDALIEGVLAIELDENITETAILVREALVHAGVIAESGPVSDRALDLDAKITLHVIDMREGHAAVCLACDWSYYGTEPKLAADGHTMRTELEQRRDRDSMLVAAVRELQGEVGERDERIQALTEEVEDERGYSVREACNVVDLRARIQAALTEVDSAIEDFITAAPNRVNETGYYELQAIRRELAGSTSTQGGEGD